MVATGPKYRFAIPRCFTCQRCDSTTTRIHLESNQLKLLFPNMAATKVTVSLVSYVIFKFIKTAMIPWKLKQAIFMFILIGDLKTEVEVSCCFTRSRCDVFVERHCWDTQRSNRLKSLTCTDGRYKPKVRNLNCFRRQLSSRDVTQDDSRLNFPDS